MVVVLPAPRKPPTMMKRMVLMEVTQGEGSGRIGLARNEAPEAELEETAAEDGPQAGSEDIDGPEAATVRARNRDLAPAGQVGDQARPEVAGGVEARLRERRDHRDQDRDG